jgi:hypothetical protein
MNLDKAISDVQDAETELARELRAIGERHAVEHDLYHLAHTLARRCASHLESLAPFAERYGAKPRTDDVAQSAGLMETLREKSAQLLGHRESSGLLLLNDLRTLYLSAQQAEINWVILGQAAQAIRDSELIEAADKGRQEAETRGKWLRTRIKETAPQTLATGRP